VRNGGRLVGNLVGDRVRLWPAQTDGELLATIWPGEYRACLKPLALLDEDGRVIAGGGEPVHVVGGFLPCGDPRAAEHNRGVFFVSQVMNV
jgi:hypothetical protein